MTAAFTEVERSVGLPEAGDRCQNRERNGGRMGATPLHGAGEGGRLLQARGGPRPVVRPAQPDPGAHGTPGTPAAASSAPRAITTPACRWIPEAPTGPRARPLGCEERPAPHPGHAPGGTTAACATGMVPAVMGILHRTALHMLCTLQHNISADVSIGLLRNRIGRRPWILASALP